MCCDQWNWASKNPYGYQTAAASSNGLSKATQNATTVDDNLTLHGEAITA
jgi:hypothetical protein